MYGSGREALTNVREWSGVYPKCPGVVGKPSQLSVSGGHPSRMSESGREAFLNVREWSEGPPECAGMM